MSLALVHGITRDTIEERARQDAEIARKAVLSSDSFELVENIDEIVAGSSALSSVKEAYKAIKNNEEVGYVFTVVTKGYGGQIKTAVGIEKDGKISGVKIVEQNETPGLGSKASEKPFMSQLAGFIPNEGLVVVKSKKARPEQIEAISGATITSKAVVDAVQAAVSMSSELAKREVGQN